MKNGLFNYNCYKKFIIDFLSFDKSKRGERKELAKFIGCQNPFVTQVLGGDLDFNLDQAFLCTEYFALNVNETEYFMLLVQKARAGSSTFRKYLDSQIQTIQLKNTEVKSRLQENNILSLQNQAVYHSNWHFGAIHMALTIPRLNTRQSLAEHLKLPLETVDRYLFKLLEFELIEKVDDEYSVTGKWFHVENDSPFISKHHSNLHFQSLKSLDSPKSSDLHYSAYFTCSKVDLSKIQEILLNSLTKFDELVRPSKEEELAGISINLFNI